MRRRCLFLILSALTPTLASSTLDGIWAGQTTDRNGDPQDLSFRFVQQGTTLQGKVYGDNESTPIHDGSVDGDRVSFFVTTELNGQISKTHYVGSFTGSEMRITRERIAKPGPKPDPKAEPKPDPRPVPKTVILKRLT